MEVKATGVTTLLQLKQINKVFNEATPDEKMALANIDLQLK